MSIVNGFLVTFSNGLLTLLFLVLPLFFGGMYLPASLLFCLLLTSGLLLSVIPGVEQPSDPGRPHWQAGLPSICLIGFTIYLILHTAVYSYLLTTPPSGLPDNAPARAVNYLIACVYPIAFVCMFLLANHYLYKEKERALRLIQYLGYASGVLVAAVALSHWVSDNGKLFWIFEPKNVFIGYRARWPFVNANHLAHFLIIPFFITLLPLLRCRDDLLSKLHKAKSSSRFNFARFLSEEKTQRLLFATGLRVVPPLVIAVAILASISRGGYIGVCVGLIVFFYLQGKLSPAASLYLEGGTPKSLNGARRKESLHREDSGGRRRRRRSGKRRRSHSSSAPFSFPPVFLRLAKSTKIWIAAVVLLLFTALFADRGIELIDKRLALGLTSSKSEIRFQLYKDSLPMLKENFFFGIGFKNWERRFPAYMSENIAGINPVYLHSDPFELWIELGIIALLPLLLLILIVLRSTRDRTREASQLTDKNIIARSIPEIRFVHALLAGWAGLLMSSFFDFPFRIPAIAFSSAVYLAVLCYLLMGEKASE